MGGWKNEITEFLHWYSYQNFQHKILVAGNHDFYFEKAPQEEIEKLIPPGIIYLNDSGTTIGNLKIWGSPVTPWFYDWAFNRHRGAEIKKHWDLIPADTDILITHGPVHGLLDENFPGHHLGCEELMHKVQEIKPRFHICGHIHEAYGTVVQSGTLFINASILNEKYKLTNEPVMFDL
jgi:Icc-related predicted phosphoesterase